MSDFSKNEDDFIPPPSTPIGRTMNTEDQKQYQLMSNYLEEFEKGNFQLDRLINVLDALLEVIQNNDENWQENFRSEWWTLEQVYAVALDREEEILTPESENLVYKTIENMKSLLNSLKIKEKV